MKAIKNNVIIKIDTKQKEKFSLTKDVTLFIEKGYNFNLREDRASMGYVIDGCNIPEGTMILCHYLSLEPTYEITNETILTDEEKKEGFKVFSIPKDMCFCYYENKEWHPCENYLITKRIFKPYKGNLVGVETEQVKNRLYVVKGSVEDAPDLSGKVCIVTAFSDYEIIFHNTNNREESVIRTRDREIEAIDEQMLKDLKKGKYLIGLSPSKCEYLK